MNTWIVILAGSAISFLLKLAGYLVPSTWLRDERLSRVTDLLPAALLGALVATQGMTSSGHLVADARLPALAVAAGLLLLRAPFIVVVVAGATVAAVVRLLGWG